MLGSSTFTTRISIHALREESDLLVLLPPHSWNKFLSTLSVRRATFQFERPLEIGKISIHALREESDFIEA